jgi:hypothetical protein
VPVDSVDTDSSDTEACPDEHEPALQGCLSSTDGTRLQTGEKISLTIAPPLVPSSDQISARVAVSRMECYNAMYTVASALRRTYDDR